MTEPIRRTTRTSITSSTKNGSPPATPDKGQPLVTGKEITLVIKSPGKNQDSPDQDATPTTNFDTLHKAIAELSKDLNKEIKTSSDNHQDKLQQLET